MAEIKVDLTQKSIKAAIKRLKNLKQHIEPLQQKILDDIAEVGLEEINKSLSSSNFEFSEPVTAFSRIESGKLEIGIQGSQAIYEEFGTGTLGQQNPHDLKGNFSLNNYNSGETIRNNRKTDSEGIKIPYPTSDGSGTIIPVEGLYWTYKYNGQKIYTQGRPAGAHVYKASQRIKKNIKKIIERRVGEELSKL